MDKQRSIAYHRIENQSLITQMYKDWILMYVAGLLLPWKRIASLRSAAKSSSQWLTVSIALITCGEILLNNPTVDPPGPFCGSDQVQIMFTGSNLPAGDSIEVFADQNPNFNPFNGGGTKIGAIPIEYNCNDCPAILGIMSDPCVTVPVVSPVGEEDNEFMILSSGCGFNVSDLVVDFDVTSNNFGAANDDIGTGTCSFSTPDAGLMAQLSASLSCGSLVVAAGPGTEIPAAAIVLIFTDNGNPDVAYSIEDLCQKGLPVYVLQNSCERTIGAFSNNPAGLRTYGISTGSCNVQVSWNADASYPSVSTNGESVFRDGTGAWEYISDCTSIPFNSLDVPDVTPTLTSLTYQIPASVCGTSDNKTFYFSGIINLPEPCEEAILTPPAAASILVMCDMQIDPAYVEPSAPSCEGESSGQISFNPGLGISGGSGSYSMDWDNMDTPGNDVYDTDGTIFLDSLSPGNYGIIVTDDVLGCSDTVVVVVPEGAAFEVPFQIDSIQCFGGFGGVQVLPPSPYIGVGPLGTWIFNWDNLGTMGDDDYGPGEVDYGLDPNVDDPADIFSQFGAGTYQLTISVSDDPNFPTYTCIFDTTFVLTEPPQLTVSVPNVNILCFGGASGNVTATPSGGTPGYTFDWSHLGGTSNPATVTGLTVSGGPYHVTVTDANGCTNSATVSITQPPSPLTATVADQTLPCDDGSGMLDLMVSGGTTNYTFIWSNGSMTEDLSGLFSGTYTVTVTDMNGCTATASATIDIDIPTFMPPPDDGSVVPCLSDALVQPIPPPVVNSCNDPVNSVLQSVSSDPFCFGEKIYTFLYTDPASGNTALWTYTYTIDPPTVTLPPPGMATVDCVLDAVAPPAPQVFDNCGEEIFPSGPVPSANPSCGGIKTWTYTYTACDGQFYDWVYTYTINTPTVTLPPPGSGMVDCPADATAPTPPPVTDNCGNTLTPSAGVPSADPMCAGVKTWTFTYTACDLQTYDWVFTYTINPPTVTLPPPGSLTVDCPADATAPSPPAVSDNCGRSITPSAGVPSADPPCAGDKTWTFTYTACDGQTYDWVFTYTISPPVVTLPPAGGSTVDCPADALLPPAPPPVSDNCGRSITPSAGVPGADPPCAGDKTWTFTYTACDGQTYDWVYTYTINPPTVTLPPAGSSTVDCPSDATAPAPPAVSDNCGRSITPSAGVPSADPVCGGPKTWTFTYTACDGQTYDWVYTYTINPPTVTLPPPGGSTVDCPSDATAPTPPPVTDNCGNTLTPSAGVPSADPMCGGPKTWTFTYTACDLQTYDWVYTYTINPPTVTLPPPGNATVDCPADATAPTPPPVTDNCGNTLTPSAGVPSADPMCAGVKTWTFTYTACDLQTYDWVFTYTINPPTVTLPPPGSLTVDCPADATAPSPPAVSDNCGRSITPSAGVPGADPPCAGDKTWTFTYTACDGQTYDWVFTYTISPPVVTLPPTGGSTVDCPADALLPPAPPPVTDNCGRTITPSAGVPGADPPCSGDKTWTFTYTACDGQTYDWVYTYTINPPTVTLPPAGSSTVDCPSDATAPAPPAVSDNCGRSITPSAGVPSADPVCGGPKTWTFTYSACDGQTYDWVYTYTINPPTVTLPPPGGSTVDCPSDATAPTPPPVADNCGNTLTPSAGVPSADPLCGGPKTWTFTYTACDGQTYDWVYTYTINPPTVTLPPAGSSTVDCPSDATAPTPPPVMDNCGNTLTPSAGVPSADPLCGGPKTWTFTYTACDGQTYDWVYTYTINPPTVTLPPPGSATVDCPADATLPTPPPVTDNCGNTLTPSAGVPGADPPCAGDKTWTFTYTACDGMTYDWVFTYTINPPTVTLPPAGSSTVDCPSDASLPPAPPPVTDNCGRTITPSAGVPGADPPCSGDKTWTFTYTACDGQTYDWVYTYTINPPTVTLPPPGSSTVDCPSDATAPAPPPVTDNCGRTITPSAGVPSADPLCGGPKTWTFTYTACDGQTYDWVYTYTINPPTVTLPPAGSSTVDCPSDATAPTPPPVADNCGNTLTPSAGVPSADPLCGGPKTWTFTFTACDGQTYDWVYTYTINPPTVTLPPAGSSTVDCPSDATAPTPPPVMDNCGNTLTPSAGVPSADPLCGGPKTWTFTYTACDLQTYDWVYTYTINPPTVTLPPPGSATVDCPADATLPTPPPVTDNCGNTLTPSAGVPSADPPCAGDKTWTFTYTACDGMTYDWVFTYTINPPTVTLPPAGSSTVDCPSDASLPPAPPPVTDNCGRTITPSAGVPGADPPCSGDKTWTFTYTACDGQTYDWVYTYTINPPTVTLPPAGSSTVDCPSDATAPAPPAVSDNCGRSITPSAGVPSADPLCGGLKTWTFTYTACDGQTYDWVYTYTINPPTVTLPPAGSSTVDCPSDATAPTPPPVADNCGNTLTPSAGVPSADPLCGGPKTWTFTYTACDGQTYDWVYTYTINPPTVTLPPAGSSTVDCPSDATAPTPPPVMDNCGNTLTPSAGVPSADPLCGGPKTWTFTYTACDGQTYDWVYTYTINPPTVTLPPPGSATVDCPADATLPTPPPVTDNCGNTLTPSAGVPGADPPCAGDKTWTFTYTACDGMTYDWVFTYTINPPTVTLPPAGGSTVDCPADASLPPAPPPVTDNCGRTITPSAGVPGADPPCSGDKTWTFTYTACDGQTYDWVYTYTINPPTVTLPPPGSSTVDCPSDATAPAPPPVTDNCGRTITPSAGVPSADPLCGGPKTWTFTYTACDGQTYDWVYTYTINPPTVTLPPPGSATVDCLADAIAPSSPPVTDNCGNALTPTTVTPGSDPLCDGIKTWTLTFTSCDGQTYDWVFTYTINPPTVTLPPPGSAIVDCPSDAIAPTPPPVTDNCGNALTPSAGVPSADPVCGGIKTWTFTFTACDGQTYDWVFTYTVNPPTVTLPPPGSATVDCPGDALEPTPPPVMDICGNVLTPSAGVPGADPACAGDKTWTFTYTACDGQTFDWIFTYTVSAPTVTLPPGGSSDISCLVDALEPVPPVVMDNCGRSLTPSAGVPGTDPLCNGIKTWTFTYTACDGQTYDWVYTYNLSGNVAPVFDPAPADVTVNCLGDVPAMTSLSYTDDCSPDGSVSGVDSQLSGMCPAVITRTWSFTDDCGNVGTAQQNITIQDDIPPTASDPSPLALPGCNPAIPAPDVSVVTDEADNCTPNPIVAFVSDATSLVGCLETTTRTYSVSDSCGNSILVTQIITRTFDMMAPVISGVPGDLSVDCIAEVPPPATLSYTDNCSPAGTVDATQSGPAGMPLTITYTWTITDDCGNTTTETQVITINETLIPHAVDAEFCEGGSVTVYGTNYDMPGVYQDTVTSTTGGCDTLATITITELPVQTTNINDSFCQGQDYVLPDGSTTAAGGSFGPFTFTGSNGCDSIVMVDLVLLNTFTTDLNDDFCQGEDYILPDGTTTSTAGMYGPFMFIAANGCDSIVNVTLTELSVVNNNVTDQICSGVVYVLPDGSTTTMGGTYGPYTFVSVNGCDSIVTLDLSELPNINNDLSDEFCEGDDYILPDGSTTTTGGLYGPYTFPAANGCDSIVTLNLSGSLPSMTNLTDEFCSGDIYVLPDGSTTTVGGSFGPYTFVAANGCDSIVNLTLNGIDPILNDIVDNFCTGESYTLPDGSTTMTGGSFGPYPFAASNGCDSIVTVMLTELSPVTNNLVDEFCEGSDYTLPDGSITTVGGSFGPYTFTGSNGCDSIVNLELDAVLPVTNNISDNFCEGDIYILPDGSTTTTAGSYGPYTFIAGSGCDSVVNLVLNGIVPVTNNISDEFCEDENYILPDGSTTSIGGTYGPYTFTGSNGCDSTVNVTLTELLNSFGTETYNGCEDDGYSVVVNGTTYDQATPTGTEVLTGANGCDSIVTINLYFNPTDSGSETYTGCTGDGYSVTVNGVVYNEGNAFGIEVFQTPNGCDTTVQINLTFNNLITGEENYTGCEGDGYSVVVNGTLYNEGNPMGTETFPTMSGCDSVVTINLVFNTFEPVTIDPAGPVCSTSDALTLTATPSGGTWSGAVTNDQFDPDLLGIGIHEVIYTVNPGPCQSADTIQIEVYDLVISCAVLQNETLPGDADGEAEITITGGIPVYNVSWTGPVSGSINLNADGSFVISSLTAGMYTVEVEDASGCLAVCQFTITSGVPCEVSIDNIDVQDATCSGINNGALSITSSGGQPPHEYSLDGVTYQSSSVFADLAPGSYTVYVRDNSGCFETLDVMINAGPGPELNLIEVLDASCGIANGSISVDASGGSTPYQYSIDGISYGSSGLFPGLGAENYSVYLLDNAGCADTIQVSVNASNAQVINDVIETNATCGNDDGSLQVLASGGVAPLEYSIDGVSFQISNIFNNLGSGTYTITVRDASGCEVTTMATIIDIGGPQITAVNVVAANCGASDGSIEIIANGNTALQYSINGVTYFSSNIFNNLAPGSYTVFVRDANGCIASQPVTLNTIDGPQITNIIVVDTECGEDNGSITIIASGGTGELEYSITGFPFSTDNEFPDLPAGDYEVTVIDENGCEATQDVTIEPSEGPDFDVYITPSSCGMPNGIIELDGFGGAGGYTYSIDGGPFGPVFTFTNKPSDFYTVAIRDANGCIYEEEVFLFEVDGPHDIVVTVTDPDCGMNNGIIEIEAEGSEPLEYSITLPFFQSSPIFDPVAPGSYTITVRDEDGCTATATAVVNSKPVPVINNIIVTDTECGLQTGSIQVLASGGVPPLQYALDGGAFGSNNLFNNLGSGTYTVTVKGANDCEVSEDVTVVATGAQFSSITESICDGNSITIEGETFDVAGTYNITIAGGAANGCDSVIQLMLSVLPLEAKTINEAICEGDIYTYNGVDYFITGQYVLDTLSASTGCDTILTLDLTVNPLETLYLDEAICTGGVYTINGVDYTLPGEYLIDTVSAMIGCDSIRILRLVVDDFNQVTVSESICEGEVFTINGMDFSVAGLYVVDTLMGPGGCDTILSLDLSVNPIPDADAGADQQLACAIPSVTLEGSSSGGSVLWSGPGIDAGNEGDLMPVVAVPGTYILTVTSTEGCQDTDTVVVTSDPSTVVADAGPDAFLSCDIDSVTLEANPTGINYIYEWSGPGINGSNANLPNPVITVPGTYTLIVTDTLTDCISAPDSVIITNIAFDLVAIIQDPVSLSCFSTLIDLNATGSSVGPNIVYIWIDDEGNVIGDTPLIEVSTDGMFMFIVKDTLSGCFDEDTVFVEDLTLYPPVDAGDPQQLDCNTETVTLNEGATNNLPNLVFDWEGPPGGILTPDHLLSIEAGSAGYYYLTAIDTVTGCENEDSVLVTDLSQLPLADIDVLEFFTCLDSLALLDIGNSETGTDIVYQWNGPGYNDFEATMIEPGEGGSYYLTVVNEATGCIAFDTVLLEFPDLPVDVAIDITIPICRGDSSGSFVIGDITGGTPEYLFSIDGIHLQTENLFDSLAAGTYLLTVVDANGCSFTEQLEIPEGELLTIDIGPDIELELGDSIMLNANVSLPWSQIDSIVWALGDHLSCTHCIDPTLYALIDEIISATVYSGNCVAEDELMLRVDVQADVYIPNVFKPDFDGKNDYITVFADPRVRRVVYLEIFDRWGNMVFKNTDFAPNDPTKGWDGTFKNQPMNPAVFAYIARVELLNGDVLSLKGDITLIR